MRKSKQGFMHASVSEAKTHMSALVEMMQAGDIKAVIVRRHRKMVALMMPFCGKDNDAMPEGLDAIGEVAFRKKPAG
jgi:antitoxin (DNA-binding transcriptional repressor) of toxin-antitoxin stability system